jgi:fumarylpyruvate hydrolase
MIWKVPEMIAYLSRFYDIAGGDLIMSGTPAGVGPINEVIKWSVKLNTSGTMTIEVI